MATDTEVTCSNKDFGTQHYIMSVVSALETSVTATFFKKCSEHLAGSYFNDAVWNKCGGDR